jgi:hypothetical protein
MANPQLGGSERGRTALLIHAMRHNDTIHKVRAAYVAEAAAATARLNDILRGPLPPAEKLTELNAAQPGQANRTRLVARARQLYEWSYHENDAHQAGDLAQQGVERRPGERGIDDAGGGAGPR